MAKKPTTGQRDQSWYDGLPQGDQSRPANKFVQAKFVRGELSDSQKEHLKAQKYTWDDITEHIDALVELRYKITVSKDAYNTAFAVWLTPQAEDDPNHGYILSARGPTACAAFAVAFYKHFTMFDGVWPKDESGRVRDPWG